MWLSLLATVLALALCACQPPPRVQPGDAAAPDVARRDGGARDQRLEPGREAGELGIDPALRAKLFAEVNDYLTADDVGSDPALLARLDSEYKAVPFAVLAEAVRTRPTPAKLPATGVVQAQWSNPQYEGQETYHAFVPPPLAAASDDRFPLLLFLHGAGGNGASLVGDQSLQQIAERLGVILVAPTVNVSACNDWVRLEDCMAQVVYLVRVLKRRLPIDDSRAVLSGFSMGGRGSFSIGVAYPEPYAGLVPVAGSIGAVYASADLAAQKSYCQPHVENVLNQRLHYISGELDMAQMIAQNRGCEAALKELGNDYVYSELKGQGHVWPLPLWEQAVSWVLARPREAYPKQTTYNIAPQLSAEQPGYIWLQDKVRLHQGWAEIDARVDAGKPARLQARLEPPGTIRVSTKNVARASLYLADAMLDLDATITAVDDSGATLWQGKVARDRRLLLEQARRRAERTMVFAARVELVIQK